ncbi:multiple epidermal growth factor-like domains 10, partial [Plakobranchus ocellatus]
MASIAAMTVIITVWTADVTMPMDTARDVQRVRQETDCISGFYGIDCGAACSSACKDGLCNPVDGHCDACPDGFIGDFCNQTCTPGSYGQNCTEKCSINCEGGQHLCSPIDGSCVEGCTAGYQPPLCVKECSASWFGPNCEQLCSIMCQDGLCNVFNGSCLSCPDGRVGVY